MLEESVVYQDVLQQGERRGWCKAEAHILLRFISLRFGRVSPVLKTRINNLSSKQLENLTTAFLQFQNKSELIAWLEAQSR